MVHLLPEWDNTKRAVELAQERSRGSSASAALSRTTLRVLMPREGCVNYQAILIREGIIQVHGIPKGRKPSAWVPEAPMQDHERMRDWSWAQWWMTIGGFQAPITVRSLYVTYVLFIRHNTYVRTSIDMDTTSNTYIRTNTNSNKCSTYSY